MPRRRCFLPANIAHPPQPSFNAQLPTGAVLTCSPAPLTLKNLGTLNIKPLQRAWHCLTQLQPSLTSRTSEAVCWAAAAAPRPACSACPAMAEGWAAPVWDRAGQAGRRLDGSSACLHPCLSSAAAGPAYWCWTAGTACGLGSRTSVHPDENAHVWASPPRWITCASAGRQGPGLNGADGHAHHLLACRAKHWGWAS